MNRSLTVACSVVAIFLVSVSPVGAVESTNVLTVENFLDFERESDPQLSPDGTRILYTRSWIDRLEDSWQSDIWIVNADGSRNCFLTKGSSPRRSPDGTRFAYTNDGGPKGCQLFARWLGTAEATQITRVDNAPSGFKWSPDGESIAFVMRAPPCDGWKIDMPKPPEGAKLTEEPCVIERVCFRQDRRGFMKEGYIHLFLVDAGTGTPRQLTNGKWNVGAPTIGLDYGIRIDWTPDKKEILFDGLMEDNDPAMPSRRSHLYSVDVTTTRFGAHLRRRTVDRALVSPDGKRVAFTGFRWIGQTSVNELYVI